MTKGMKNLIADGRHQNSKLIIEDPEAKRKQTEAALFPFQKESVDWLIGKKLALLSLEMGMGKSLCSILGADRINANKLIVVCPSIARINFLREFEMWSYLNRDFYLAQKLDELPKKHQSIICSYEYITANYERLKDHKWKVGIIDESHYLKEPATKRTKAVLGVNGLIRNCEYFWMLSGTPAPNNPSELWILLYTAGRTKLSYQHFTERYCHTRKTDYGLKIDGAKRHMIPELIELLRPIILRKLKKDHLKQLPPIHYSNMIVEAGEVDVEVLPSFSKYMLPVQRWDDLERDIIKEKKLIEDVFFNMDKKNDNTLTAIEAIAPSVATVRRYIGLQKVDACVEHVDKCFKYKVYDKVVIFAIHTDVITALASKLKKYKPVVVFGKTPPDKRQRRIDKFQNTNKCKIFIGNIKACGVAINLTAASNVIFIEQDWVPGNNAQAVMRCHRIGQTENVTVKFMQLARSVDEMISKLLRLKTKDLTEIFDKDLIDKSIQTKGQKRKPIGGTRD